MTSPLKPEDSKVPDPEIPDQCPPWAHELILKIRDIEFQLGNLIPPHEDWYQKDLDQLVKRLQADNFMEESQSLETLVEDYFRNLARGLAQLGYDYETIALFVNTRLTGQSRLAYCSPAEVREAVLN
jgi:hypothetical protein